MGKVTRALALAVIGTEERERLAGGCPARGTKSAVIFYVILVDDVSGLLSLSLSLSLVGLLLVIVVGMYFYCCYCYCCY